MSAAPDDLRAAVAAQGWFHTIDLGDGIVTDGRDESPRKLGWIDLPPTCAGARCSTWARGTASSPSSASAAGPTGSWLWMAPRGGSPPGARAGSGRARGSSSPGARSARRSRTSSSSSRTSRPHRVGRFDVVLFLGVLYHLKHPWVALERVASVCDGPLILETHADLLDVRRPAMAFYPGDEVAGDASNWWGPNLAALKAMLREEGFARVEVVHREPLAVPARARGLPAAARAALPGAAGARGRPRAPRLAGLRGADLHARALEHERRMAAGAQPPGRVGPRVSSSTEASRARPRQALSKVISAPAGVTWRLREAAANGSRRARGCTVAWTDQPAPSASSSKPPRGSSGQAKRASVLGSAQFSRPPRTDGSESTAMNGTDRLRALRDPRARPARPAPRGRARPASRGSGSAHRR